MKKMSQTRLPCEVCDDNGVVEVQCVGEVRCPVCLEREYSLMVKNLAESIEMCSGAIRLYDRMKDSSGGERADAIDSVVSACRLTAKIVLFTEDSDVEDENDS